MKTFTSTLYRNIAILIVMFTIVFSLSFTFANAHNDDREKATTTPKTRPVRPEAINIELRGGHDNEDDDSASSTRNNRFEDKNNRRAALEEKRAEMEENREARRVERKERLEERARERIMAYVERITRRLDAALDRMIKMADRLDSRILKLEEKFADKGLDLSDAKALVIAARSEIDNARNNVASIEGLLDDALSSDNPKESFSNVREIIKDATSSVKIAHKALVEAIKSVKASVGIESSDNATTTPESSNATSTDDN